MVRACHTPQQPLENHPLMHLRGWAMPWLADFFFFFDGQHQRVDTLAYAKTAHKGLVQKKKKKKKLEENLLNRHYCPPEDPIGQGSEMH